MQGKCLCGKVEFEVLGAMPKLYQCHCSLCRKLGGSSSNTATIVMGEDVIAYFKSMSKEMGIPYQSLINLYLRDCVAKNRRLDINWTKQA